MESHEVDYEIFGDDMQTVEIELDPQETVIAEARAMNWMTEGITYDAKMGDGSKPKSTFFGQLLSAGKRAFSGESLFMTHFTNEGEGKQRVCFAAPYPGKIIPLDLKEIGGEIICQRDSFLCAALGTRIDFTLTEKFGVGFFGGEGFILQKLTGDGRVFIHAGGTIVKKRIKGGRITSGYWLHRGIHSRNRIRHQTLRKSEIDVLRRRRDVRRFPQRHRNDIPSKHAILQTCRPRCALCKPFVGQAFGRF